jgi:ribosome assembly protein YihI (activator of Der GTPase)
VIARRWVRPAEKDTKDLNALLDRTEGKVPEAESQHGIDLESIAILMETLGDDSDSAQGGEESPQIPESAPTE